MTKLFQFLTIGIFLCGVAACNDDVATPPKVTIVKPDTNKKYKVNTPITLQATLFDKTGLGTARLKVYSAWAEKKVFADTQENLGGGESLDYTTTFVIDTLLNYPKATYVVQFTVADIDGNAKEQELIISLQP